jgi:N-acetylglutamate synthase-like GNAT family acetyltransferase
LSALEIRPATSDDAQALLAISIRADQLFSAHGFPQIAALPPMTLAAFRRFLWDNCSLVAWLGDARAGFAVCGDAADSFWLKELAVDPVHGRRAIGTALVAAVIGQASEAGHRSLFLSTFRDVPFNRPFYASLAFAAVDTETASEALRAQFLREVPAGIAPETRVLMVRALSIP